MSDQSAYETVIGLEVHAQLQTVSKLFCGDATGFGAAPNEQVSAISLAHPGTLPKINRRAIELAVRLGLACDCRIERRNYFARKNYFYPDLPKGYQISQHTTPICVGGHITITLDGGDRHIPLNRIHLEEDAGKSIHDASHVSTSLDFNRAGTPLVEIVTEPALHSAAEVAAYLTELRKLVRYLGVCDGNMEEGSFRCDVNISLRRKGSTTLGTKVEIKNLNSIRNARRAVEYEEKRLAGILATGGVVTQQTRQFDAASGKTSAIRDKEDADDYRYFADPDLPPFQLHDDFIEQARQQLPALQRERMRLYMSDWKLSEYDARNITDDIETAAYFEGVVQHLAAGAVTGKESGEATQKNTAAVVNYKAAANWILGPLRNWMNDTGRPLAELPVSPATLAELIRLVDRGVLNFSVASARLLPHLVMHPGMQPEAAANELGLVQQSGADSIGPIIDEVLSQLSGKVAEYKKGKKGLLSLFVGEVIKRSKGKADPKVTNQLLLEKLNSSS